jgi:tetratricopeptide (TPR) repeat protein
MNPYLLILTIGLVYVVLFGGLSLLRREGLSTQFAFEVIGITAIFEAFSIATGIVINPIVFMIALYLITMRVRLLVDLAIFLSNRGRQRDALKMLDFCSRFLPDKSARLIVLVNMGIVQLRRENPQHAQELLSQALDEAKDGGMGLKYETASHYNLGIAYKKLENKPMAIREFNEAKVLFPTSIYSKAADRALEELRSGKRKETTEDSTEEG